MTDLYSLRQQILTLHYIYPLPLQKLHLLLNEASSAKNILALSPEILSKLLNISVEKAGRIKSLFRDYLSINFDDVYKKFDFRAIVFNDKLYPKSLLQLHDPPSVLYAMGDVSILKNIKIAVIGSRKATSYTNRALQQILPPLIEQNYVIVSGFAKGADTIAHELTILYGGQTVAVLGNGFQHIYPKENRVLFEKMKNTQCFVTEYPYYMPPRKWHFPMRNRIISGMSDALVVTEAAEKSGTLITTEHALEHGKDVFVVPGPIDSSLSIGTNALIKEGAIPVWNGYQIVEDLKLILSK